MAACDYEDCAMCGETKTLYSANVDWPDGVVVLCAACAVAVPARLADAEAMAEALRARLGMLDGLVAESGRSIEWGEEDAFRMGEWFEPEDMEGMASARASLDKWRAGK